MARPTETPSDRAPTPALQPSVVLCLNDRRQQCPLSAAEEPLLELLAAAGIAYELTARAWQDPALGVEPLLVRVADLAGPLEIVHNGQLAAVGVAHLRLRAGDEVVIGQPAYLRLRFPFFR